MATSLQRDFPELSHLSYVYYCLLTLAIGLKASDRREDLEDLLTDPVYFQAIFHSLEQVKALYQAQSELGMANESIASMLSCFSYHSTATEQARKQPRSSGTAVSVTQRHQRRV